MVFPLKYSTNQNYWQLFHLLLFDFVEFFQISQPNDELLDANLFLVHQILANALIHRQLYKPNQNNLLF